MDSIKDLVREKLRIEDVIGSYITLIPIGKNFKACCPFHQEKTASFQVNPDRQFFYCFGCKRGGDVFNFVQEIERLDFREALKMLAEKAGIDMRQSRELSLEMEQKKKVLEIHEYATRFYQLLLSNHPNVIEYLKSRGLTSDTLKTWRIGYAPDGFNQLIDVLRKKGFKDNDLIASGLVGKRDRGIYDRFRGRIMFPITGPSGKIIAFSGRIMPGTHEASRETGKYINSPETIIYHKSSALFGFSYAKKSIAEKKSVILVEGQFDAILLHQSGYANTVALSGTACTSLHIEQLNRFANELIIATDSDRAGIQSAYKIAELGYQFGSDVSVMMLPPGKDPADIIAENPDAFAQLLETKQDYIAFHGHSTQDQSLRDRIGAVETHLFPILARVDNHVRRDAQLQSIAQTLHVSIESIRKEFQKFLQKYSTQVFDQAPMSSQPVRTAVGISPLTIQIQELAMIHTAFPAETGFWFMEVPEAAALVKNQPEMPAERSAELLTRYQSLDSVAWKIRLDTLWIRVRQLTLEEKIDALRTQMSSTTDPETVGELQQQLMTLHSEKESLIRSLAE